MPYKTIPLSGILAFPPSGSAETDLLRPSPTPSFASSPPQSEANPPNRREGGEGPKKQSKKAPNERTNAPPRSSIPLSRTIWKREARRSEVAFLPLLPLLLFLPLFGRPPPPPDPPPLLFYSAVCAHLCALSPVPPRSALSETPTQSLCKKRRPLVAAALDVKKRGLFPPPLSFDPPPSLPFNGASAVCYSQEGETRRGSGRGEEVEEEGWLASRMPPPPIPSLYPLLFLPPRRRRGKSEPPTATATTTTADGAAGMEAGGRKDLITASSFPPLPPPSLRPKKRGGGRGRKSDRCREGRVGRRG